MVENETVASVRTDDGQEVVERRLRRGSYVRRTDGRGFIPRRWREGEGDARGGVTFRRRGMTGGSAGKRTDRFPFSLSDSSSHIPPPVLSLFLSPSFSLSRPLSPYLSTRSSLPAARRVVPLNARCAVMHRAGGSGGSIACLRESQGMLVQRIRTASPKSISLVDKKKRGKKKR